MTFADLTTTVLDFVRQHPNWAALIVFALSFGESLPFISLVFPFWAILVGIGTIVAVADPVIFWTIVTAAAVGAALGDWLSYWLGYHYHTQIQQMWPLRDHPRLLDRARSFFRRWGAWGIVIARFSGPLRASVPIVAGIAEMPWAALPDCELGFSVSMGIRSTVPWLMGNEMVDRVLWMTRVGGAARRRRRMIATQPYSTHRYA